MMKQPKLESTTMRVSLLLLVLTVFLAVACDKAEDIVDEAKSRLGTPSPTSADAKTAASTPVAQPDTPATKAPAPTLAPPEVPQSTTLAISGPPGTEFAAWSEIQPTIDGIESTGEWDDADCHSSSVGGAPSDFTVCVKNDSVNLYIAVEVQNQTFSDPAEAGLDFLNLAFDNNNNGVIEIGEDRWGVRYDSALVRDSFNPNGVPHHSDTDESDGGTNDLVAAVTHDNPGSNTVGTYFAEYQHPLDTADDAHDFSLAVTDTVGFAFSMAECDLPDTGFYWPSTVPDIAPGWAQITITECPTGTEQIVITSKQADPEIWVMETDGSNLVQLTNVPGLDQNPAWSPSASQIAFASERSGDREIWTMDSDGNNQTNITQNPAADYEPTWGMTPDGERIYFYSDRDGDFEIYWMTPTGGSQTNITGLAPAMDSSPDLSADGTMIAFDSDRDQSANVEIYSMTHNGGSVTRLTDNPAFDFDPVWSPDGTMIAFVSNRDGNNEIYAMEAEDVDGDGNGDNLVRLTTNGALDEWPSWSSDGNHILFSSLRSGNFEVYQMDPVDASPPDGNGDNLVNINNTPLANETRPDWSPVAVP